MVDHRPVIRLASLYNGITLQNELWGYSVCGAGHHFDLVYSDGTVLLCDFPSFRQSKRTGNTKVEYRGKTNRR